MHAIVGYGFCCNLVYTDDLCFGYFIKNICIFTYQVKKYLSIHLLPFFFFLISQEVAAMLIRLAISSFT